LLATLPSFSMLNRIRQLTPPTDPPEYGLAFFLFAAFMAMGGLTWGLLCLYFEFYMASAIPLGYTFFTLANYVFWKKTGKFRAVKFVQVAFSISLPFLFQWLLGGYRPTGVVMLWAVLALIGLLTFYGTRYVLYWAGLFLFLTIISVLQDSYFSQFTPDALHSETVQNSLMAVNFFIVSFMLFVLARYFVQIQRETVLEVRLMNHSLKASEQEKEQAYQEVLASEEEIRQSMEELTITNEQLAGLQDELQVALLAEQQAKTELEKAKDSEIAKKNEKILSSINYAKRIQDVLLPSAEKMETIFPHSFVLYRPRDVVSGDFYWSEKIDDKRFLVVADCTGHGVPGALMAMLGIQAFSGLVLRWGRSRPSEILTEVDARIRQMLQQKSGKNRDGMDAALIALDDETGTLEYAGAKVPLIFIANGSATRVKANVKPIGGHAEKHKGAYTNHMFAQAEIDAFYLFSDGYQDQMGGPEGRKFMSKRFRSLLEVLAYIPAKEQKHSLTQILDDWMGKEAAKRERQFDDILVVGVQLNPPPEQTTLTL